MWFAYTRAGGSGGCGERKGLFGVLDHEQRGVEHCVLTAHHCSEVELGASPVASGHVVSDFVVSAVSDPVGQGAVLLDLLGVASLLAESLDGTHFLVPLIINDPLSSATNLSSHKFKQLNQTAAHLITVASSPPTSWLSASASKITGSSAHP